MRLAAISSSAHGARSPAFLGPILPLGARSGEARPCLTDMALLHPLEQRLIGPWASRRRAEFATGRALVRHLLSEFGVVHPVLRRDHGEPVWPEGIVGSIAHCADLVVVALVRTADCDGLGIDVEPHERLPTEVAQMVMPHPAEYAAGLADGLGGLSIFCAKEAVYKALYPKTGAMMEFDALRIERRQNSPAFVAHLQIDLPGYAAGSCLLGQWCNSDSHLAAVAALPTAGAA